MQEVTLELEKREVTGKAVKNVRKAGFIPAVIHDHGKPSVVVQGEYQATHKAYHDAGKHSPVHVSADGKKYITIIKTVTFDPQYNSISHIVFNAVKAHEKVTTDVPVRIKLNEGNESTPAERASLLVLHNLASVEIEAPASKLPEALEFDGEKLVEVGDHVTVADLIVPQGVEVKTDAGQTIASVFEPSAVAAANDAAGGDEEEPAEGEEVEATDVAQTATPTTEPTAAEKA
ncbi:MAG TPA: 50S ribosomal protein L25 [Candidatus Saccharimonadales bacterium]|nr:50S ribosomal protein L25 [Candidatus Saccharimonadales bacterium]